MKLKKGLVQIYTGDGKGKTTAAIGLALRAQGAGVKVYMCQFIKSNTYNEIKALKKIKGIKVEQYGRGCFIKGKPEKIDMDCARKGLLAVRKSINSGKYSLVIMDEINVALHVGLIKAKDLVDIIKKKPSFVELVLTGRYCPASILKHAHLVTEMKEIKHPYKKGIKARVGIEY